MADQYREPIDDIDTGSALKEKLLGGGRGDPRAVVEAVHYAPEREHGAEGAMEKDGAYGSLLQKVTAAQNDDDSATHAHTVAADAKAGAAHPDVESQVRHLIDLAQVKGAVHAVRVAQRMSDLYVLDAMHDRMLAEQLHAALEAKGMI